MCSPRQDCIGRLQFESLYIWRSQCHSNALVAGANVGDNVAIFEQGARHVGKDIAGKGIANPLATLLSTSMMFRHLNLPDFSDRYESSSRFLMRDTTLLMPT